MSFFDFWCDCVVAVGGGEEDGGGVGAFGREWRVFTILAVLSWRIVLFGGEVEDES